MHWRLRFVVVAALIGVSCGPAAPPTRCEVDGESFAADVPNPNPEFGTCQRCKPTVNRTGWTNEALGSACGQSLVCIAGGRCSRVFRRLSGTGTGTWQRVAGTSADDVWVIGPPSSALRTTDRGASWTTMSLPGLEARYGIYLPSPGRAFVVGAAGTVLETSNGGQSWTQRRQPMGRVLKAVWGFSASELIVVGADGYIGRSTDEGQSWRTLRSTPDGGIPLTFNGLWSDGSTLYIVGEGGTILRSTDRGNSFTRASLTTNAELTAVFGTNGQVFAVGSGGTVLRSTDGQTWEAVPFPNRSDLTDLWGVGSELYVASASGSLYRSTDSGARWVVVATPGSQLLFGVWGSSADDVYTVGASGLVYKLP